MTSYPEPLLRSIALVTESLEAANQLFIGHNLLVTLHSIDLEDSDGNYAGSVMFDEDGHASFVDDND